MSVRVKIDITQMDKEIADTLTKFQYGFTSALEGRLEKVADWGASQLRRGGPYKERTGKYTADWAYREEKVGKWAAGTPTFTIYNKKHYRLTHLLENGHRVVLKGGRVAGKADPRVHIAPVDEKLTEYATLAVENAVDMAMRKV